jgi:hypothetical protein
LACVVCLAVSGRVVRAADISEAQARSAFLVNFTHFVEWPSRPAGPLVLCVAADAALVSAVTTLVHSRPAGGQEMRARGLAMGESPEGCHVLYVGFERAADRADLMQQVYGPVLTVGDSELFLRQGGIIRLFVHDTRMRFQIDQKNADAAGLRLSALLLDLAER